MKQKTKEQVNKQLNTEICQYEKYRYLNILRPDNTVTLNNAWRNTIYGSTEVQTAKTQIGRAHV